ncbi:hypothetical protein GA0074695_1551 [Micromonospora viridifaciens]|uniref:Uncharacterized protein n=1 Tax=Micromonospora viridifaciens TaxID=1881 RepID=A0A1C4VKW8_MICVI|nr:hypothetical protein [Micromonospora viridifaciens]SCE84465.1 hypothetical protein GA0074695_1551 [Micromonospora viridifaciens]
MTPDPTMPLPPPEPPAPAQPTYDPWAAMPPAVAPPTEQLPVLPPRPEPDASVPAGPPVPPGAPVPADEPPTMRFAAPAVPPAVPGPVPPAAPVGFSAPPVTAQFSAPPAVSAPPVTAQFSAPPASYPAELVAQPGSHPPVPASPLGPLPPGQSVVAVQIGEIMVAPPVIRTPAGVLPLAGASWHVVDHWQKEEKIATWALVCAIVGFFCLTVFSLLFLLIKETKHHGTVQVTVTSGGRQYVARIPVVDQGQVQHINNQVNYARSLSFG